jgi:AraC-like DNA-binding protein
MERAKYLLETTDRQVQDVSEMAGYETVTGFINAF